MAGPYPIWSPCCGSNSSSIGTCSPGSISPSNPLRFWRRPEPCNSRCWPASKPKFGQHRANPHGNLPPKSRAQPPKPIRCNITTTGPPLIWTAVVYDRRSFLLIISALIERRHSKLRHYRREEGRDRCLGGRPRGGVPALDSSEVKKLRVASRNTRAPIL